MNNQRKTLYYCECSVVAEGNEGRDGGCQAPTSKAILSGHQKLGGTKLMNSWKKNYTESNSATVFS